MWRSGDCRVGCCRPDVAPVTAAMRPLQVRKPRLASTKVDSYFLGLSCHCLQKRVPAALATSATLISATFFLRRSTEQCPFLLLGFLTPARVTCHEPFPDQSRVSPWQRYTPSRNFPLLAYHCHFWDVWHVPCAPLLMTNTSTDSTTSLLL